MRARTVVPDDEIVADLDEVARALPDQRRRRRSGPKQRDRQRLRLGRRLRPARLVRHVGGNGRRDGKRRDELPALHRDVMLPQACRFRRARLEAVVGFPTDDEGRLVRLVRDGIVRSTRGMAPKTLLSSKPPRARKAASRRSARRGRTPGGNRSGMCLGDCASRARRGGRRAGCNRGVRPVAAAREIVARSRPERRYP